MGDEYSPYDVDDMTIAFLEVYIKFGYGDYKLYETWLYITDDTAMLTIQEYYNKIMKYKKEH